MKNLLNWIKSNVISVVSIVAVILALGFLGWVHVQGGDLEERAAKEAGKVKTLASYSRQIIEIPSKNPDDPPRPSQQLTINEPEIAQMRAVNEQMDAEYQGIFAFAVDRNRAGKRELVQDLFPNWQEVANPFIARDVYREAFVVMLEPVDFQIPVPSSDEANEVYISGVEMLNELPRLNAGMPPDPEQIDRELAEVQDTFMSKGAAAGQLSEDEQNQLDREKRTRLLEILIDRAQSIHLYAETDIDSPDFPFDVGAIGPDADPTAAQLWEAQIELWFQQDIAASIAAANQTDNNAANVLTSPIKRLLKIEVAPGYVGLHNLGGVDGTPNASQLADYRYSAPNELTGSADRRQSDNFFASPTGRVSNALYDIRHARVTALVDFQRLPEWFEAISNANMMTVVGCDISSLDEYEALEEGYVYGSGDIVSITLTIESVWLRDWTAELMHDHVKMYLGLMEPDEEMQGIQPGAGPYPDMFGPYGPGGPAGPGGPYSY